jgi:broad specificity phosphatase PhoE
MSAQEKKVAKEKVVEKKVEHAAAVKVSPEPTVRTKREHAEFHNAYTIESVKRDVQFLKVIHGDDLPLSVDDVNADFIEMLKGYGTDLYFFISSLTPDTTPQIYLQRKHAFTTSRINHGDPHLLFLTWNGLVNNDSFKRILRQKMGLDQFGSRLCPQNVPSPGSSFTRYRTKFILAEDMASNPDGSRRTSGRALDDGSGLNMREELVWLPNGKCVPMFPNAYVPLDQTQMILVRHGRSLHESGGDNPEFVGSGLSDGWEKNRRVSRSIGNSLGPDGIRTAQELGMDFQVAVKSLEDAGYQFWSYSKENPVPVFGSESENTEQTARYFLAGPGYTNMNFQAIWGLNSQQYGSLTHRFKKDIFAEMASIYGADWKGSEKEKAAKAKAMLKNRFFQYPEGETLIEADWRIGWSFIDLLRANQGRRILLCDHSGAIRVFEAIIKTLDFAEYASRKEAQDSIMTIVYQPGKNVRYDYLQRSSFRLR